MMAKFTQGSGFDGAVVYANKVCDKHATILSHRGVNLTSHSALVNSFEIQRMMNPSVKNFVGHLMLSFSPRDRHRMTSELMNQIALEYMHLMGLDNTQYAVFRHRDQPHDHVHVIYNRVDDNGNPITNDTNYMKSIALTKMLTRKYGLTWGKGKENVRRERLKGKDKSKYAIYDAVKATLRYCKTADQLRSELARRGIDVRFSTDESGKIRGVSFSDGKSSLAGGRIDKSLRWNNILSQLEKNRVAGLKAAMAPTQDVAETHSASSIRVAERPKPATDKTANGITDTPTANGGDHSDVVISLIEAVAADNAPNVGTGSGSGNNSTKTESEIEREKEERNCYRPKRGR